MCIRDRSIYKSSTASTSTVSNAANAAMEEMMAETEGLHLTPIMDQGDYIKLIVNSVLSNLIEGAILAIIVLALFLNCLLYTSVGGRHLESGRLFAAARRRVQFHHLRAPAVTTP